MLVNENSDFREKLSIVKNWFEMSEKRQTKNQLFSNTLFAIFLFKQSDKELYVTHYCNIFYT